MKFDGISSIPEAQPPDRRDKVEATSRKGSPEGAAAADDIVDDIINQYAY